MGYRIFYGPMPPVAGKRKLKPLRLQVLTAAFLLLFTLTVRQAWPEGTEKLRQLLLPGEPTVTEAAFQDMIDDLQEGEPLADAFTAFCRQIIEDGTPEAY